MMVDQTSAWYATAILLLVFPVGCSGPCNTVSQEKLLQQVGFYGELLVNAADPLSSRYGRAEGAHPERASWRAFLLSMASCVEMPSYDRSVAWDSKAYEYLHTSEFNDYFQVGETTDRTDSFADIMAVTGEGTAFDALVEAGSSATGNLPTDAVLLLAAVSPDRNWMECTDLEVERYVGPDASSAISLPSSPTPCGRIVHFVDGETWLLEAMVPDGLLYKFFRVESAGRYDRDALLGDYLIRKRPPSNMVEGVQFGDKL